MKLLLINSPLYREHTETDEEYLPPLGLYYIATHLKKANIEVEVVDCVEERLGVDEIFKLLVNRKPDYFALNIFTQNLETVREIAEKCPVRTTLIIGGQVVKSIFSEIMTWSISNNLIIIIGESELILPEIIKGTCEQQPFYCDETKKVYRVENTSSYFPSDLDKVCLDRAFLKDRRLINHYGEREVAVITSRGCTYDCAFCGAARSKNCDTTIRLRSYIDVKNEITAITSTHPDVSSIRILDDLFLRDIKSINAAIKLFSGFPQISWRGMAHILTFVKTRDLLPLLHESNCRELFVGVESGSNHIRERINKSGTTRQVVETITEILKTGIDVKAYLMFGFPNETKSEANETYALAKKLKTVSEMTEGNFRVSVFQFRPYHGTTLYDELIENGVGIGATRQNESLNIFERRLQFNFYSGNYSRMSDEDLNKFVLQTQQLTEETNA